MSYEGVDNNSAKVVSPARLGYEPAQRKRMKTMISADKKECKCRTHAYGVLDSGRPPHRLTAMARYLFFLEPGGCELHQRLAPYGYRDSRHLEVRQKVFRDGVLYQSLSVLLLVA